MIKLALKFLLFPPLFMLSFGFVFYGLGTIDVFLDWDTCWYDISSDCYWWLPRMFVLAEAIFCFLFSFGFADALGDKIFDKVKDWRFI